MEEVVVTVEVIGEDHLEMEMEDSLHIPYGFLI